MRSRSALVLAVVGLLAIFGLLQIAVNDTRSESHDLGEPVRVQLDAPEQQASETERKAAPTMPPAAAARSAGALPTRPEPAAPTRTRAPAPAQTTQPVQPRRTSSGAQTVPQHDPADAGEDDDEPDDQDDDDDDDSDDVDDD